MAANIIDQIMALKSLSLEELKAKYEEVFKDEKSFSTNKTHIWHRIAYRIQEIEYGGLSENAKNRISDLIDRYDPINKTMLRPQKTIKAKKRPYGTVDYPFLEQS